MNYDYAVEMLRAAKQGKTLQRSSTVNGTDPAVWEDIHGNALPFRDLRLLDDPTLTRIKPEPREWWLLVNADTSAAGVFDSESLARRALLCDYPTLANYKIVRVREVLT